MSEQPMKEKKPLAILREKRGGIPEPLMDRYRKQRKLRKSIVTVLEKGPKTVPEIAGLLGIPSHEVLWIVMGMKKYGDVKEGKEQDNYYEYMLLKEDAK